MTKSTKGFFAIGAMIALLMGAFWYLLTLPAQLGQGAEALLVLRPAACAALEASGVTAEPHGDLCAVRGEYYRGARSTLVVAGNSIELNSAEIVTAK